MSKTNSQIATKQVRKNTFLNKNTSNTKDLGVKLILENGMKIPEGKIFNDCKVLKTVKTLLTIKIIHIYKIKIRKISRHLKR
jgi:hypothetical protein